MTVEVRLFDIYNEVTRAADWLRGKYNVGSVHGHFEQEFNAKILYNEPGTFPHRIIFNTAEDYTVFMLRWS
jgi:hypothetical protein